MKLRFMLLIILMLICTGCGKDGQTGGDKEPKRNKQEELKSDWSNCGEVQTLFNGLPYAIIPMLKEDYAVMIPVPENTTDKNPYLETVYAITLGTGIGTSDAFRERVFYEE